MRNYTSDSTDSQWKIIEKIIQDKRKSRKNELRTVMNAILYLLTTGCQWRNLPREFGAWTSLYYYFDQWKRTGLIEEIYRMLHRKVRIAEGRGPEPTLDIIDSQSVKTTRRSSEVRGFDGGKKIKRRKRHIICDTLRLPIAVIVHAANIHDSKTAPEVIDELTNVSGSVKTIIADGGYRGKTLADIVEHSAGLKLEITLRKTPSKEFKRLFKRWIIERSFSWLESFRRLSRDYEFLNDSAQTMIYLAFIKIILNKF